MICPKIKFISIKLMIYQTIKFHEYTINRMKFINQLIFFNKFIMLCLVFQCKIDYVDYQEIESKYYAAIIKDFTHYPKLVFHEFWCKHRLNYFTLKTPELSLVI